MPELEVLRSAYMFLEFALQIGARAADERNTKSSEIIDVTEGVSAGVSAPDFPIDHISRQQIWADQTRTGYLQLHHASSLSNVESLAARGSCPFGANSCIDLAAARPTLHAAFVRLLLPIAALIAKKLGVILRHTACVLLVR